MPMTRPPYTSPLDFQRAAVPANATAGPFEPPFWVAGCSEDLTWILMLLHSPALPFHMLCLSLLTDYICINRGAILMASDS
jgi:hypothetical protein